LTICARIGCEKVIPIDKGGKTCSIGCKSTYYRQRKITKKVLEAIASGDYSKINYNIDMLKTIGFQITEMKPV